ncbi:MAG: ribonuclease P protein subunit [Candidatus Diapherotrites archaeon]|nr:ribonuclease P protein subunit [Candidatus Diapherotrites archaeon]MDZ4256387.1 ribonuclease P protein subunit [archaeon]
MIKGKKYIITPERLPVHELIGINVHVVTSRDPNKGKIEGKIVDETQRTFTVETEKGIKMVPKNESIFAFNLGDEQVILEGKNLLYSPVGRLKALWGNR